jgi:hypothetical protein
MWALPALAAPARLPVRSRTAHPARTFRGLVGQPDFLRLIAIEVIAGNDRRTQLDAQAPRQRGLSYSRVPVHRYDNGPSPQRSPAVRDRLH